MPFGKYKGTEMQKVPASYLLWLKSKIDPSAPNKRLLLEKVVLEYIDDNLYVLKHELKNDR